MSKKHIRWIAILSLIGGVTLTTWLNLGLKALALPTEQIVKTLQPIPVFTIVDDQGVPLIGVDEKNKNQKVAGVFISQSDANKFFQQLQQQNPDVAKKVKVRLVNLGEVYKVAQNSQGQPDGLTFAYVPTQKEVEEAKKILTKGGQEYKGGVPLFVARAGKDQGYLSIEQNNQVVIPMFFEVSQLNQMVDRFKKEKPDLASSIKIEVVALETFLATMKESNDQNLTKFILIPSDDSIKAVQSSPNQPAATPTPKPGAK